MKVELIGKPQIIMSNQESRFNYFAWPTIVKMKNNKIAVGASGFRMYHICPFGKAVISFSEDGGKTFTAPAPVIDTFLDDRDTGLCPFGKSGLIVTSFNNTVKFQMEQNINVRGSQDEKAFIDAYLDMIPPDKEKEALGATFRISTNCGVTFGKLNKSPITSPHGPIELNDGTILWVGATFREDDAFGKGKDLIEAYKINPDGNMEKIGEIKEIYKDGIKIHSCEPYAIQLSDGTILCHIRTEPKFTTYQSKSTDGGKTWSVPEKILPDHGGAPAHLIEHSSGVLISLYGYRQKPNFGIRAMFSKDGGETWDIDNIIYENVVSADLGYPSTVELDDGNLLTVFYAHPEKDMPAVIMKQEWHFTD